MGSVQNEAPEGSGPGSAADAAGVGPGSGPRVDKSDDPIARAARIVTRSALTGSLATLQAGRGHPYASLVLVAYTPDGAPILLLSTLALHTRNLAADPRASLLLDGTAGSADPMSGDRATLIGTIEKVSDQDRSADLAQRFVRRHPAASQYAGFADFAIYTMAVESCHFIGGFGRIHSIVFDRLAVRCDGASALLAAATDIVQHMNDDHHDAVQLYAEVLARMPSGERPFRMTGIDPTGIDIAGRLRGARLEFPAPVTTPDEARKHLVALVAEARGALRALSV
ncbi:MAG: DUF2470 domain-containing protein [Hyphomicrobiaceae bacterium]|nr:DUF2470 domain-containing protein [Hyphomicrobiaceae bacterium]